MRFLLRYAGSFLTTTGSLANVGLYDAYRADDGWPRAFLGEYSSRDRKWRNALTEAAYLTGVERSPAIGLACYAPMLCNTAYANWDPDMIYFDNHRVYGTPSYWVQRMFMTGQGTQLLESGDDMQPAAVEPPSLAGLLRMTTARAVVDVTDFVVRDANGSVIARQDAFTIDPDHPERICGDMPSDRYAVECSFVRRNGDLMSGMTGRYSFGLDFAMRDNANRLRFDINGWQRQSGLNGYINGGMCGMQLVQFVMERGVSYRCRLVVDGPHVQGWLDDTLVFDYTVKPYAPRPLYYSAVRDADAGETIVKLVNVNDTTQPVTVRLSDGAERVATSAVVESIEGAALDDANDFDEPERVAPRRRVIDVRDGSIDVVATPYSFLMLRIR